MDTSMAETLPASFIIIAGLIQFALFIWIFIFPVIIIRKLNDLIEELKNRT